jgi:hypothetical protein
MGMDLLVPTGEEAGWGPEPVWMMWEREEFFTCQKSKTYFSALKPIART